jgi:hypothetical protein
MDETVRDSIRHIFLSPRPHVALLTASSLLGITFAELKKEVEDGAIVAVSTAIGRRVLREEMVAAAMRTWDQATIEEALGQEAASVLPEALRLVELRARVPCYQKEMLRYLARREGMTVDHVLVRGLDDVASAHAEELAAALPGFAEALAWPTTG